MGSTSSWGGGGQKRPQYSPSTSDPSNAMTLPYQPSGEKERKYENLYQGRNSLPVGVPPPNYQSHGYYPSAPQPMGNQDGVANDNAHIVELGASDPTSAKTWGPTTTNLTHTLSNNNHSKNQGDRVRRNASTSPTNQHHHGRSVQKMARERSAPDGGGRSHHRRRQQKYDSLVVT